MHKKIKLVGLLVLTPVLFIGFQNCSRTENASAPTNTTLTDEDKNKDFLINDKVELTSIDQEIPVSWNISSRINPNKIKSFEVCLGSTPNQCDVVDWKNVGLEKSYKFSTSELTLNSKYFVSVRYIDIDTNLASRSECGDGFHTHIEMMNSLAGTYQGCAPSIHGSIYYDYYKITIDRHSNYTAYYELFNNSTCTGTAINKISFDSTISSVDVISTTNGVRTINVDLKTKETTVLMAHPGYYPSLNNNAECGFTNWSSNSWKNVTGKTCPFLLQGDIFHDTYRNFRDPQYITIKYRSQQGQKLLDVPVPFRKSGDTPAERENLNFTRTSDQSVYLN